jgi:hypothetical protein
MMNRAIMLDLETLATTTGAAITQIAAVVFNLDTGSTEIPEPGAINLYIKSGPGVINRETAMWWMQQPHAAVLATNVEQWGCELHNALAQFNEWLDAPARKGLPLYAHGAPFDFPVLRASYEVCGMVPPWHRRDELCCRPLYRELPGGKPPDVGEPQAKHDALADCYHQIKQLVRARKELMLVKGVA